MHARLQGDVTNMYAMFGRGLLSRRYRCDHDIMFLWCLLSRWVQCLQPLSWWLLLQRRIHTFILPYRRLLPSRSHQLHKLFVFHRCVYTATVVWELLPRWIHCSISLSGWFLLLIPRCVTPLPFRKLLSFWGISV